MKLKFTKFWTLAMVGYVGVVLLLASGMVLTAWRFDRIAISQVERIRSEELQITVAERLRWSGEVIVSTERGYLISADSAFLTNLDEAQSNFDRGLRSLTLDAADARSAALVAEVQNDATQFRGRHEALMNAVRTDDVRTMARRFETELVPLQKRLGGSLRRLIEYKETALDSVYDQVSGERARLRIWLNVLVVILTLASLAIAAYVATRLGRSYRKEQEALETSRKALAARDEIMGVVAHDLRTPLASISMRAELMLETTELGAIRKHAGSIVSVTGRMADLIRSMLDVTTIESGHFTVMPEPCAVDGLLEETTDMFGELARPKRITLERSPILMEKVNADRERVLQVLANLVGNAIKFTPVGGRVELTATRLDSGVCFSVSDSGPGIATADLPHVFDRFWKHESPGKKGTGLGLFIAKGIVEAHGGHIWVENRQGDGTTFRFTLPCSEAVGVTETRPTAEGRAHAIT